MHVTYGDPHLGAIVTTLLHPVWSPPGLLADTLDALERTAAAPWIPTVSTAPPGICAIVSLDRLVHGWTQQWTDPNLAVAAAAAAASVALPLALDAPALPASPALPATSP